MNKTKKTIKEKDIENRRNFLKEKLSLTGTDALMVERATHFDDEVCDKPVRPVRLREATLEPAGEEVITLKDGRQVRFMGCKQADNGFLDAEGFLWFRIKADAPRSLITHFLNEWLDILPTYPLPGPDHRKKSRFRGNAIDLKEGQLIYEAHEKGKSLLQIARERSNIKKGSPRGDAQLKAAYAKVSRLYNQEKKRRNNG